MARITAKPPKRMPTVVTETSTTSGEMPDRVAEERGDDQVVLE